MSTDTDPGRWAARMSDSVIARHPADQTPAWVYEWGLTLKGILDVWRETGDDRYFDYVRTSVDHFVQPDGTIRTYPVEQYNVDFINPGKNLFPLYELTGDDRYAKAAGRLRDQMRVHPRTYSGGFWHKLIYPNQMWLDGIYMASPFLAGYAAMFDEPALFDDVVHQITLAESHTRDPKTGLLYHGWDESKLQKWADPETGCSPHFWGRAIGWFSMALPDVLDVLPADHPRRGEVLDILNRLVEAIADVQDPESGVWYQVIDLPERKGNYLEASASCMFTYTIAKSVRCGYISREWAAVAQRAYPGILEQFISVDDAGLVSLNRICEVAGLGGDPYRDASFECYINERIVSNDFKGVGPFILASVAMQRLSA
jgi:unsaturated rhamnogalacturonyl hydrolase